MSPRIYSMGYGTSSGMERVNSTSGKEKKKTPKKNMRDLFVGTTKRIKVKAGMKKKKVNSKKK